MKRVHHYPVIIERFCMYINKLSYYYYSGWQLDKRESSIYQHDKKSSTSAGGIGGISREALSGLARF